MKQKQQKKHNEAIEPLGSKSKQNSVVPNIKKNFIRYFMKVTHIRGRTGLCLSTLTVPEKFAPKMQRFFLQIPPRNLENEE